jgi:hypothetical protein
VNHRFGLANSAIRDALYNTATKTLFVDLVGLSVPQATVVKNPGAIRDGW